MTWLDTLRAECARTSQRKAADLLGLSVTTVNLVLKGKYMSSTDRIEARVRERLTDAPWLRALREEVTRTSQARTAERLGISEATVSQVLSGNYKADTARIERRVRGELLGETVECRVMFDVSMRVCQDMQERKQGQAANPAALQCHAACRGLGRFASSGACPHFNGQGGNKQAKENAA